MMRHASWIRLLSLLCAGVCGAPLVMAGQTGTTQTTHKSAATAGAMDKQQPAPAATAPKAAATTTQRQPSATAQPQPAASTLKPSTNIYTRPVTSAQPNGTQTTVPAQSSAPAQAQTPGMYTYKPVPARSPTSPPATTRTPPPVIPRWSNKSPCRRTRPLT